MTRGRWLFLIPMALVLGLMFVFAGINIGYYLDIPAIILVNGVSLLAGLSAHGLGGLVSSFASPFRGAYVSELKRALAFWNTIQRAMIVSGLFGMIAGLIAILVSTENLQEAAWGLATSITALLIAAVELLIIVIPFKGAIEEQLATMEETSST